jgi:hypothetical protein
LSAAAHPRELPARGDARERAERLARVGAEEDLDPVEAAGTELGRGRPGHHHLNAGRGEVQERELRGERGAEPGGGGLAGPGQLDGDGQGRLPGPLGALGRLREPLVTAAELVELLLERGDERGHVVEGSVLALEREEPVQALLVGLELAGLDVDLSAEAGGELRRLRAGGERRLELGAEGLDAGGQRGASATALGAQRERGRRPGLARGPVGASPVQVEAGAAGQLAEAGQQARELAADRVVAL